MGNSIQILGDGVRLIASTRNWIEGEAVQQLKNVSRLAGMQQVVGLPDLHPGRGYPIGAACFSVGCLYPALVGNDIGCGMAFYQLDSEARKIKLDKWEKRLRDRAFVDQDDWTEQGAAMLAAIPATGSVGDDIPRQSAVYDSSLGTIGGGNHFAEFQKVGRVVNPEVFQTAGLDQQSLFLLVHSGSRGLGEFILRKHVDEYHHAGLASATLAAQDYLREHDFALHWASVNRQLIAERISLAVGVSAQRVMDVNHNFVVEAQIAGQSGWLHRKGVTPSDQGLVIIPGSRGSESYLVKPASLEVSLNSLAHGAGRKWMRADCEGRLRHKYQLKDLGRTRLGSRVICDDKALMYEEAPEAYKPIDTVVQDLVDAGLAEVVAEFLPVMTCKTARSNSVGSTGSTGSTGSHDSPESFDKRGAV
jgi:release factor H-coupled RctB family protein